MAPHRSAAFRFAIVAAEMLPAHELPILVKQLVDRLDAAAADPDLEEGADGEDGPDAEEDDQVERVRCGPIPLRSMQNLGQATSCRSGDAPAEAAQ